MSLTDKENNSAILMLEDGVFFIGKAFGAKEKKCGEVIFCTGMTGYQEVFSDPSYKGQIITMTYPHIGNYGINLEDFESRGAWMEGIVVREYNRIYSNWRATESLGSFMIKNNIVGIEGIDTQALTTHLRDHGAMRGIIAPMNNDLRTSRDLPLQTNGLFLQAIQREILKYPKMEGRDLVPKVTCKEPYVFYCKDTMHCVPTKYRIVVYDYGIKTNILRMLQKRGCELTVVPATFPAKDVFAMKPDGVFLSNGPGDPYVVTYAVENVKKILEKKIPIFGICLGHQLLGVALGGKTYKLPFGHHGVNHPVKNLKTGSIEITSQNHGFCVDMKTLSNDVEMTHINLNDKTCEGLTHKRLPAFSVQYHPESAPGPHDSSYLFDRFIKMLEK